MDAITQHDLASLIDVIIYVSCFFAFCFGCVVGSFR